ncbi:MAG: DUF58 domain-containing protein [Thermoanaerobacteraceae bacterium]|nr:DUF58 domain-containing protein [Thermoanaerobacteraceae bacterium]
MIYALIFLVIIGITLNSISKKYVLYNLTYRREISKKIVEIGEEFEVVTVVENRKMLPVTFLQVIEKFPSSLNYKFKAVIQPTADYVYHTTTMLIMPYQRVKRNYRVYCNKRGRFIFRDVTLIGGDLLGFNTTIDNVDYSQDIVVLPKVADLDSTIIPYGDYNGDFSVKRWIIDDPVLTIGIKEYTGTEPEKTIHWPSSLKSGRLMVKKFDYTSDNTVMVLLNIECSKPFWAGIKQEEIEECISIARAVVEKFEESGIPYGFTTDAYYSGNNGGGSAQAAGFGATHYYNIVENLGRIDYDICMSFEELLLKQMNNNGNYTTFVIITPSILEPYIEPINNLSKKAMKTIVITLGNTNMEYLNGDILAFIKRR